MMNFSMFYDSFWAKVRIFYHFIFFTQRTQKITTFAPSLKYYTNEKKIIMYAHRRLGNVCCSTG